MYSTFIGIQLWTVLNLLVILKKVLQPNEPMPAITITM